ncbi:hypothetical protein BH09PSE2_BH09PSE2_07610 [soil metagenome]
MVEIVTEGVWRIADRGANTYLVDGRDGLTLIDTGFPDGVQVVLAALGEIGRTPADLKHIVATHAQFDHIGSLADLVAATGATTWMHVLDAPIAEGREPFRHLNPPPGLLGKLLYGHFAKAGRTVAPARIDHTVSDGDLIPAADGLRVVHIPGHCLGQIALIDEARSTAFVGDVAMNVVGLGDPIAFEDLQEGRRSQKEARAPRFRHRGLRTRQADPERRRQGLPSQVGLSERSAMYDGDAPSTPRAMTKTSAGRFFEDFRLGETLVHATPRTLGEGDRAAYLALYAPRHALTSSAPFARACGLQGFPLDPWLVFHTVFGKTVPDVSVNAVANLGYADGRWLEPVQPGDTLSARSEVIGLKETSNGEAGVVYVRTTGFDQTGAEVLTYVRWVLVRKRLAGAGSGLEAHVPKLPAAVAAEALRAPEGLDFRDYDFAAAGSPHAFEDYEVGERIDHVDGMAVEEAEAQMATRLYQNTAKVHFNAYERAKEPSGRRLVYGGVVISTARALSYNGLENAQVMLALNGGRHVNPFFAGATLFAWSQVLETARLPGPGRIGALRLRTVAAKDHPCSDFPGSDEAGRLPAQVCLDLDYWVAIPARTDG